MTFNQCLDSLFDEVKGDYIIITNRENCFRLIREGQFNYKLKIMTWNNGPSEQPDLTDFVPNQNNSTYSGWKFAELWA